MINNVIFDMDGVLTDSEPIINASSIEGLKEYGIYAKPEDFLPFVGTGDDRYIGGVAELYGKKYFPEMKTRVYEIYLRMLPERIKPFPGVIDLINSLKISGIKMAVASSSDRIKVEANLKAIGLNLGSFQTIIVGNDVKKKKPAPDIYLVTAEKMHVLPSNCCVVEDAISGITAAKAAGMRCVAVEHSFPSTELIEAKPDRICHLFADITPADLGILNN
jgi:beta-phosphoglucomutase